MNVLKLNYNKLNWEKFKTEIDYGSLNLLNENSPATFKYNYNIKWLDIDCDKVKADRKATSENYYLLRTALQKISTR